MKPRATLTGLLAAMVIGHAGCHKTVHGKQVELQPIKPPIRNVTLHNLGASQDLQNDMVSLLGSLDDAAWAGYAVPMVPGNRHLCCGGSGGWARTCHLESGDCGFQTSDEDDELTSGTMLVMFRLSNGRVQKIRTFSTDCTLDGGGMPVYWWSRVGAAQSLTFLEAQVRQSRSTRMAERAVQAVALHDEPKVNALLENFAADRREDVAEKAIFWLGAVRGRGGFESLERLEARLTDTNLREQITFAFYLSKAPDALSELIDMARKDQDSEVREKALFWLSQKAGRRAAAALEEAVADDPDLGVKKKAVFGLSQLPSEEGVPLLIEVAETHPHPKIRKQAMFWLGQSADERALAFFEKVLLKK